MLVRLLGVYKRVLGAEIDAHLRRVGNLDVVFLEGAHTHYVVEIGGTIVEGGFSQLYLGDWKGSGLFEGCAATHTTDVELLG